MGAGVAERHGGGAAEGTAEHEGISEHEGAAQDAGTAERAVEGAAASAAERASEHEGAAEDASVAEDASAAESVVEGAATTTESVAEVPFFWLATAIRLLFRSTGLFALIVDAAAAVAATIARMATHEDSPTVSSTQTAMDSVK